MAGKRGPVRLSPRVYWRRRLAVVIVLVGLVGIGWWIIAANASQPDASPPASPSPTPSGSAQASPSPSAVALDRPCTSGDIEVAVAPTPVNVPGGTNPAFDVTITHTGSTPCKLTTSQENSSLLVISGSDRIYSSADCPTDTTVPVNEYLLQEGSAEALTLTWMRQRSAPGCEKVTAKPKTGYYKATVTIQDVASDAQTFVLN